MEVMIVVILIGILASFAIPNYTKSIVKAHVKDALVQVTTIYAANTIYKAQNNGLYLSGVDNSGLDLTAINSNLGLNIIANDIDYHYFAAPPPTLFRVTATYVNGKTYIVSVDQSPLIKGINPSCIVLSSGESCPGY